MWLKNSNLGTGLSRHAWPNQRQHVQPIRIWLCNGPANPSPKSLRTIIQNSNDFPNICYYTKCVKQQQKQYENDESFIKLIMKKIS